MIRTFRRCTLAALLVLAGCGTPSAPVTPAPSSTTPEQSAPQPTPPPPTATSPAAAPPTSPGAPSGPLHMTAPGCGYGGSMPAMTVFVDVTSDVALRGVTATFEARDPASGARVGGPSGGVSLQVQPMSRGLLDFSTQGGTPFTGELAAGSHTRLQLFAGLEPNSAAPGALSAGPLHVVVTLTAADGTAAAATCTTAMMLPSS